MSPSSQPPKHLVAPDLTELHQVLHDLALPELRATELAVAEDVRHLDGSLVSAARHDFEADLEPDGIELHAIDHRAADREEPRGAVAHRDEDVPHEARDPRHDLTFERPILDPTAGHVAAADREIRTSV